MPSNTTSDKSPPDNPDNQDQLSETDKKELETIWKFLKRSQHLTDNDTWPFLLIQNFKSFLAPETSTSAGAIPDCLVLFLTFDFRNYPRVGERSDHAAWYIDEPSVRNISTFWQNALFKVLKTWMNCQEPRTRNSDKIRCILHNLEGHDAYHDQKASKSTPHSDNDSSPSSQVQESTTQPNDPPTTTSSHKKQSTTTEVTHSIRAITSLFPNEKITGDEKQPFVHQLQPVLDQMEISNIPDQQRVSALFSILTGKARTVATKFNVTKMSIEEFTESLKKELCLDPNIRERKKHRWNNLTYNQFRNKVQTEDEATRNCIDHVKAHQKDLPPYLLNDEALMERLRGIFKHQSWCQSLYERSSVGMSASAFEELLKTAASNADDRRPQPTSTFPVTNPENSTHHNNQDHMQTGITHLVAAFFARTPPPPRNRRPFRFRKNQSNYNRSHIPQAIRSFRKPFRSSNKCFGCKQEGHFLKNCPERTKYLKRFQFIRDLGTAAAMIVDSADKVPDDELMEVANFFIENDCFEDNDFQDFEVWLCELLDVCDSQDNTPVNAITTLSQPSNNQIDPYFIQESIPEIQKAMDDLSIHSVFAIVKHLLMDTGSPKNLSPQKWLQQAHWTPIKKIKLPSTIKPFRFAGQFVHAQYAACLIAVITEIHGKDHIFRQVAFILPDIPISFLIGLQTQRSLAFDICLRNGQGSHLKMNKTNNIFPLFLQSHVWLQFTPCNQGPNPNFNWNPMIKEAFNFNPNPAAYACPVDTTPYRTNQDAIIEELPDENSLSTYLVSNNETTTIAYATPPWERDDWISKTTIENAKRLHQALRHPTAQSLIQLYRQQNEGRKLPREVIESINKINCRPCQEHAQLPRRPKLAIPQPAAPNISVSLDVCPITYSTQSSTFSSC